MPLLLLSSLLTGCSDEPTAAAVGGELVFVRDGVITTEDVGGEPLAGGGQFVERPWSPGEPVRVGDLEGVAPARAECAPIWQRELGDVSRLVAAGGAAPNTALAWSPGGDALAIGSHRGEILVLDGWRGAPRARAQLAETMIKEVAWSPDGATLYAAEQSPDANLYALDPATLEPRWTLRLADLVETSSPPAADDLYGVYTLPAAYGLQVLDDGALLLAASHGWNDDAGARLNRTQILRVTPDGAIAARWPEAPADAIFKYPRVDRDQVILSVTRSADGPPPEGLPVGGVQALSLPALTPTFSELTPPLGPWFSEAFIWEALDVDVDAGAALMGYGDGRVRILGLDGVPRAELTTGAPIMAGEVPIHASVGWGFIQGEQVVFSTSNTHIPWGAASPELRPPSAHPNENALWVVGLDGETRWSWTGPWMLQGLTLGADGRTLAIGAGDRQSDDRRDLYGALLFDLGGAERGGEERLQAVCATEGPVFFRQALSADGRLAVVEHPWLDADGALSGEYRVNVFR